MTRDPVAQALGAAIGAATGTRFEVAATRPVSGGCIHTSLEVTGRSALGEGRYFAKVDDAA
ncbi:MAG TPA: hypothetical protein VII36_06955, partial [Usitatibacter sp.]